MAGSLTRHVAAVGRVNPGGSAARRRSTAAVVSPQRQAAQARIRQIRAEVRSRMGGSGLVGALAPERDQMGAATLIALVGKGVSAGLSFLASDKGKQYIQRIQKDGKDWHKKRVLAEAKAKSATGASKQRWLRRAARYREKEELKKWETRLAERGRPGEGPALEAMRNAEAMRWEDVSDPEQKQIEERVTRWDGLLRRMKREHEVLEKATGGPNRVGMGFAAPERGDPAQALSVFREALVRRSIRSGMEEGDHRSLASQGLHAIQVDATSDSDALELARRVAADQKVDLAQLSMPGEPPALAFSIDADPALYEAWKAGSEGRVVQTWPRGSAARPLPDIVEVNARIGRDLVAGKGGMQFTSQAPPGSGRLLRLPFYPTVDSQAWTGVGGIDQPGDDPILRLRIAAGAQSSVDYILATRELSYGRYRIVGFQTHEGTSYRLASGVATGLANVAVTVSRLQLYNGQELFLQEDEMAAGTFSIVPTGVTSVTSGTLRDNMERPLNYARRRSRFFSGLRDYPVVSENTRVEVQVNAFASAVMPAAPPSPLDLPFSCNLVIELLEDRVYGNLVNPGPYARAGAVVKAAAKELGVSTDLRERVQVVSSRYRPSTTSS